MAKTLDRLLKLSEVTAICGLERSLVYRWVGEGRFPKPVKPGGPGTLASRWRESAIAEWLENVGKDQSE